MIAELGQLCLVLAFFTSLLQGVVPLLVRWHKPHPLLYLTKPMAMAVFLLVSAAFAALIYSYAQSDFSVLTVVLNSSLAKPMLYKIVGAWGNHEGSMLLWMWVLTGCGFLVAFLRASDTQLKGATLAVLGLVSAGFLAFILFTSNPFLRVFPPPPDGNDLNPILQDIGLAFHPPTLYVGYVGFGIVFAYAMAGLLRQRIDSDWARVVHPWILLPWSFLTLGIGAGSWWAYRELGWGGWWFWDPVENVSLLPWLTGTALLHSNLVLMRRGQLGRWVALLAILTFTMSLIGTFIVRSGLITSVHAFASDPLRGLFILGYIGVVSGVALLLYGFCELHKTTPVRLMSRSGFILINNLFLLTAAATILLAIFYPLILELLGLPSISVGPPYFNRTFLPLMAVLPFLGALAPLMAWDRTSASQFSILLKALLPALLVAALIVLACFDRQLALAFAGVGLGGWLGYGVLLYLLRTVRAGVSFASIMGLRHLAMAAAHGGVALLILGMTASGLLKQTFDAPLAPGTSLVMGDYTLSLKRSERVQEDNYITRRAVFDVAHHGHAVTVLSPELRYYPTRTMQTTEAALYSTPVHDIYVVLGEANYAMQKEQSSLGVRMYVTPMQQWVWAGFLLAGAGGLLACLLAFFRRKEEL